MNDQSFLYPPDLDDPDVVQPVGRDDGPAMNDPVLKRFRRGVAHRAASSAPVSAPDSEVVTPPSTAIAGPYRAINPINPTNPVADEWESLRYVPSDVRRHFRPGSPLVNYFRRDRAARAFDLLRTRLLQALRSNGWSRIAIASPTTGCGSTFTAVNLAQSLARIPGSRTVLMDLNQRSPGIAPMLKMQDVGDMAGYLAGAVPLHQHLQLASRTLALGLASGPADNAAEILLDKRCGETLDQMTGALHPGVVLYDLPPILAYDDLAAFLPQVDGVLLVTDGTQTQARHIAACERALEGQTPLLGIILNRARDTGSQEFEF